MTSALNHTAGLSLPQQVMMTMFSLYELMDAKKDYQKACMEIVHKRMLRCSKAWASRFLQTRTSMPITA